MSKSVNKSENFTFFHKKFIVQYAIRNIKTIYKIQVKFHNNCHLRFSLSRIHWGITSLTPLSTVSVVLIQPEHFTFTATALPIIWTETMLLIPLHILLAPATNLHSLKLFIEFMCHLGDLQTAGVTPGSVVTSDGPLPEPQLACVLSQM